MILFVRMFQWNVAGSFPSAWLPSQIRTDNRRIDKPHTRGPAMESKKKNDTRRIEVKCNAHTTTARRAGSAADWKDAIVFGPPWSAHGPLWPLVVRPNPHHIVTTETKQLRAHLHIFWPSTILPSIRPHSSTLKLDSPCTAPLWSFACTHMHNASDGIDRVEINAFRTVPWINLVCTSSWSKEGMMYCWKWRYDGSVNYYIQIIGAI